MKKLIIAATLAALAMTSAAMAAPLRDPQPGDLKANANYGFDQKEGGRSAKSRLTGGDVTYVLNNRWDIQYVNNYTKGDNDNKINENYLVGNYRFTPYLSAFAGGWVDNIMMRITDILYTIPDILLIILLGMALKDPLDALATKPGFKWMQTLGPNMISIFIIFALLYWVGMARIVRSQILILKESEYVTAARALGASSGRIIKKHLLTNCIGTLIVTTTLQIPASIFTESYLSFIGLGVAAPLPSLGSLATDAVKGMNTYPHLLIAPALMISVMILVFNLFGDGLRDAFDPKLKN